VQSDILAAEEHIGKIKADRDTLKVKAYDVREAIEAIEAGRSVEST
jgi:hypothetical protein